MERVGSGCVMTVVGGDRMWSELIVVEVEGKSV